jgi:hypothetical protein
VCGCGTRIFGVTYDMYITNTLRNMIDVDVDVDVVVWPDVVQSSGTRRLWCCM